jgi:hypothetical protein
MSISRGERFRSALTESAMVGATVVCTAGVPTVIASYQVSAGEELNIGFGGFSDQVGAVGRFYADLKTGASAYANGLVRVSVHSPQDRPLKILSENRTEVLRQGATDRRLQVPFPEMVGTLAEDRKLVVEFVADTTATLTKADTKILMDITKSIV